MFDYSDAGSPDDPRPAEAEPELGQPVLIHRADALARGLNVDDVKRRLARGEWQVVRRGVTRAVPRSRV